MKLLKKTLWSIMLAILPLAGLISQENGAKENASEKSKSKFKPYKEMMPNLRKDFLPFIKLMINIILS